MPNTISKVVGAASQSKATGAKKIIHSHGTVELVKIVIIGVVFHLIAIMSIFDIYFKSPLSHGQTPTLPSSTAPAKRLVFIVGDGLRADKCFAIDQGKPRAPFLYTMAHSAVGSFGVSHTRVPTESRPGHVAMLAGFYEDPSAVTKGWKENPVEYDHVVKRSSWSFTFGAPEIMALFPGVNVQAKAYSESMVDFGLGNGVLEQDKWPFDQLFALFDQAKHDLELNDRLRSDKVFFLLHLLGHDTNGHAYGPHSPEYAHNTRFVDAKIKELTERMSDFYNDNKTAFIFTADHGMSDGRSHGDGDPNNTRTPLVVWGAGVAAAKKSSSSDMNERNNLWGSDLQGKDINQADLTMLTSALLGITIPVQSEGRLPVSYLKNENYQKEALLKNVQQFLENYRVKEDQERQKHHKWSPFWPYKHLSVQQASDRFDKLSLASDTLIDDAFKLMDEITNGICYLNTYDQRLLFSLMTVGYVGWIAFGLLAVVKLYTAYGRYYTDHNEVLDGACVLSVSAFLASCVVFYGRSSPLHYYLYALFPAWFMKQIIQSRDLFSILIAQSSLIFDRQATQYVANFLILMELIVAAYFDRRVMSVVYGAGLGALDWSALALSGFTLLPPIKDPNRLFYIAGAMSGLALLLHEHNYGAAIVQAMATLSAIHTDSTLAAKQGLQLYSQAINWTILASIALLLFRQKPFTKRIKSVFGVLLPVMTILSVSYEVAFFAVFYVHLSRRWLFRDCDSRDDRWIRMSDLKVIGEFLVAINMAFFGTGNIASLSSFSLPSVYRLITTFRPFLMSFLLIFKQLIPLILLSVLFCLKAKMDRVRSFSMILLATALVDLVAIHFFFMVSNVGSWLDIGMGISRFVIANAFILIGLLLFGVGELLLM